jgi:outer membrane protein OmpA-like peptidoglycan-associated protein
MFSQPFRKLGRSLLAVSALSIGAASLGAQTPAPPSGPNPSRVDVFLGYSYWSGGNKLSPPGIRYTAINAGAIGSGAYYFNKYFGGEIVTAWHPDGPNDGLYPMLTAGPIVRYPGQYVTFFAHANAGAGRLGGPNSNVPTSLYHEPYTWGPALTVGGGMDFDLPFWDHKLGLRLFQADYTYIHTSFGPYVGIPTPGVLGGRANVSSAQLSTGLLVHFGHIIPPPPVTYSCVATPASVYAGDPITVTGTAMELNPKMQAAYTWSADGGKVAGTSNVANISTTGMAPGTYNVKGNVTEGKKPGQFADCAATFVITKPQAPTISCVANPTSLRPGGSSTITSTANSPQNRPLTYSYQSTAGAVSGTTSTATLSTAGAAPGTITVTCTTVDDLGQSASATTTVSVIAPPPVVVVPTTSSLCSVTFDRDKKRPARVDNEAKACLDDIVLNLQRNSTAKLVLVGNTAPGKKTDKLAAERAVNTKAYLVENGVDASRIMVYTGTTEANTVTSTLVPQGAASPSLGTTVDETAVKAVPRTAPKKGKKK